MIVEETEASVVWALAFAPDLPRDLCTDGRISPAAGAKRDGCACRVTPGDSRMGVRASVWARTLQKRDELFFDPFRRMRAGRSRVDMKAVEFALGRTKCSRRVCHIHNMYGELLSPGREQQGSTKVPYESKKCLRFLNNRG